jgi:pyrrolidone-carboxylate peptidase
MKPLLILSGFGKFEGVGVNPTEQIINAIKDENWIPSPDIEFQTHVVQCSVGGADHVLNDLNATCSKERKYTLVLVVWCS